MLQLDGWKARKKKYFLEGKQAFSCRLATKYRQSDAFAEIYHFVRHEFSDGIIKINHKLIHVNDMCGTFP